MGDVPKRPDDAPWTEVERTFFASAPPEEPQPPGETPRLDDVFPTLPRKHPARERFAWLWSSLVAGSRRTTLVLAALNGRRLAFAAVGSIVVMGVFAGIAASRNGAPTKVAAARTEAPASRPAVAQATPAVTPRADVAKRPPRAHRKPARTSSPAKRPLMTAFMDRETYWAREGHSAPVHRSKPLFSR
jgi:hypothetical protein